MKQVESEGAVAESPPFDYEEQRRREEEFDRVLEKYADWIIDQRALKDLDGTLEFVTYVFFAIALWIGFASLAPVVNGDDRPAWLMWLILGPLCGFTLGGVCALLAWNVVVNPLGEFIYNRQHKPNAAIWWRRFRGMDVWEDRRRTLPP